MLIQIWRLSEFRQALTLAAIGRKKKHLAIAALNIPGKNSGPALAANGLRKNEKSIVEIKAEILSLVKEDLRLYFNDGFLIFAKPIGGERWAAVFSGDVEGGDGEVLLLPPYRGERQSLAKFTQTPNLDEHFASGLLLFTDGSGDALRDQVAEGGRGRKSQQEGALLAGQ